MRIECLKEKISYAVLKAGRIATKNLTLPVLESVLLVAQGNTIKIRSTNLDLGIEIDVPAKITREGTVSVPASVLGNLLSTTTTPTIILEADGNNLTITTQQSSTHINGYAYEDFPTLPKMPKGGSISLPVEKFVSGLKSVWYSAALSDIKPEIASIYMYSEHGALVFVATDSFRLAEKKVFISNIGESDVESVLIPLKNAAEIIKVLDGLSGDITIKFSKNQISFSTEGFYVTSRLVDGLFPDYKQIIPKEFTTDIVLLKQDLGNALKIMNVFSDDFNQIDITVDPKKKIFSMYSKNQNIGEHTVHLEATVNGLSASLSFNHRYLSECLGSIPSDSISIKISGENKPMILRGVGDKTFMYLVMPLNK